MDHLQEAIESIKDVYRDDVSEQEAQTVTQLAIAHALIALVERMDSALIDTGYRSVKALNVTDWRPE